jgi:electron transfer flavoprotein beta subunit
VQNIIKAKKKPLETINLADMGIDFQPRLKVEKVESPSERAGGVIVSGVDELLQKLRNEAKVI